MHSSWMCTTRLLTVSCSITFATVVSVCLWGVCLRCACPWAGGVCPGAVCQGGCLPRSCLPRGMSTQGVSVQGGVCQAVCLGIVYPRKMKKPLIVTLCVYIKGCSGFFILMSRWSIPRIKASNALCLCQQC